MRKGSLAVVFGMLMTFWAAPAFAAVEACDPAEDTELVGTATVITFDSCKQDLDYTPHNILSLTYEWMLDPATVMARGSCTYNEEQGVELRGKGYTPISKRNKPENKSPAEGTEPDVKSFTVDSVTFDVSFSRLHSGKNGDVAIGNGKYTINLNCDTDGDGQEETVAKFGVNVHVCQDLTADGVDQCTEDS